MANIAPLPQPDSRGQPGEATPLRPRDTIGALLRRTRMEQGGEIDGIAASLRIRAAYLAAIEQGRTDRLPGAVYALGFVRSYATHLGLDAEEAVRRFKLESSGFEQRRDLSFPVPLTQRSIPGGRVLLLALVLAVCAYFFWQYLSTEESSRPERVAAVPTDLLPPPPPAPAPAAAPPPAPSAAPAAEAPTATTPAPPAQADQTAGSAAPPTAVTTTTLPPPAPGANVVASAPPPAPSPDAGLTAATPAPAPPVQAAPAPAPAAPPVPAPPPPVAAAAPAAPADASAAGPHVFGVVTGPSRITLRAVKDCWIQVRDSDASQTVVATRTLHAGDTYRVPEQSGLTLRTGNATGLQVLVDDKPIPALGGTVRTVALDPARLLAGTARAE